MENNSNNEKTPRTEVFINCLGQEVTMTYNPALDNQPIPEWASKKLAEVNHRLKRKPVDLAKLINPKTD